MPVTTRKQLLSIQTKKAPSSALSVVNNTNKITTLDQLKNLLNLSVESVSNIEIEGTMNNIDISDYEDPFGGNSFYESYEPTIKLNGQYGQTTDQFYTDIQREKNLAYLQDNQQNIASALFEEPTCLLSPPMSEYDPCSPAARSRSASATDMMVPSPYVMVVTPASPAEQHAPLDILDEILNGQTTSQTVAYIAPPQSQDVLSQFEMICPPQETSSYELDDILDFISSQPNAPREMWTQEQTSLKAAISTQESFSSQAFPSLSAPVVSEVPAAFGIDDAIIDEILSAYEDQSTCASPAHSVDSSYSTASSASPARSETSDEEFLPVAELKRKNGLGGNKRGRKRKNDGEFGEEQKVGKKQKNAEAAARYRQKKKEEDAKASEALDEASAELAKTREKFDRALKKRNLILQMFFEQAKNKIQFPSWVEAYLQKHEI